MRFEATDGIVKWKAYSGEKIRNRFSTDKWNNIAADISTNEEWEHFINSYPDFVKSYILEYVATSLDIAFVYLYFEEPNVVSIHGGGWEKPLLYYRGYILMLRILTEKGYKVRTYCSLTNSSAIRFSRSVGFIPYRYTGSKILMWLSEKSLKRTILYKRFYTETIIKRGVFPPNF